MPAISAQTPLGYLGSWFVHLLRNERPPKPGRAVRVFTDGAIRPEQGLSGLAAIVMDINGNILHWWNARAGKMTCNEAEYAAAILALERLSELRPAAVDLFSDSQIVVEQMTGRARVKNPKLRIAHASLSALVVKYPRVTFHHIPRQKNELADALANQILQDND